MMQASNRTGFILYVDKYDSCVSFYRDVLQLPIMFTTDMLTCFDFSSAQDKSVYLMVEMDDREDVIRQTHDQVVTCLRINVPDVKIWRDKLTNAAIPHQYGAYDWGTICKFHDPAGNLIGIKDSPSFDQQILEYKNG